MNFWQQWLGARGKNSRKQRGGNIGNNWRKIWKAGENAMETGLRYVEQNMGKMGREECFGDKEWEREQQWKGGFGGKRRWGYEQRDEQEKERGYTTQKGYQEEREGWIRRNLGLRRKGGNKKGKEHRKKVKRRRKRRNVWRRRGRGKSGKKYVRIGEAKKPGPEWVRHRGEDEGERDRRELRCMRKAVEAMLERMEKLGRELGMMRMIEWRRREQERKSAWRWDRRVWEEVKEVKSSWEGNQGTNGGEKEGRRRGIIKKAKIQEETGMELGNRFKGLRVYGDRGVGEEETEVIHEGRKREVEIRKQDRQIKRDTKYTWRKERKTESENLGKIETFRKTGEGKGGEEGRGRN